MWQPAEGEPLSETLKKAAYKAAGGGIAGGVAMFVNVGTLMCAIANATGQQLQTF